MKELWLVADVAKVLRLAPKTVYNKAERGELPRIKLGGAVRFIPDDIYNHVRRKRS